MASCRRVPRVESPNVPCRLTIGRVSWQPASSARALGSLLLPLFAAPNTIQEDALITARYPAIWRRGTLVYNVGERVLGTPTAWHLDRWIFWIPVPPHSGDADSGLRLPRAVRRLPVWTARLQLVMPRAMFLRPWRRAGPECRRHRRDGDHASCCASRSCAVAVFGFGCPIDWWRRAGLSVLLLFCAWIGWSSSRCSPRS